jgi:pyrroloquinoline quinone (PQQ) biosynthesis protein C
VKPSVTKIVSRGPASGHAPPSDGAFDNEVCAFARELFGSSPIERHPFLSRLGEGAFSHEQAQRAAVEIYHVVDHFPRLLAALLANLPQWTWRMALVENLFEEHGRMEPARVHVETYKVFLTGLGVELEELAVARPAIPVIAYNRAMLDLCLHHPYAEGLGALGVVEEIVARASRLVARFCRERSEQAGPTGSWSMLGHFADHEVLDLTHAHEIYTIAAQAARVEGQAPVRRGMELGWYYHRRLYSDILELVTGDGLG